MNDVRTDLLLKSCHLGLRNRFLYASNVQQKKEDTNKDQENNTKEKKKKSHKIREEKTHQIWRNRGCSAKGLKGTTMRGDFLQFLDKLRIQRASADELKQIKDWGSRSRIRARLLPRSQPGRIRLYLLQREFINYH